MGFGLQCQRMRRFEARRNNSATESATRLRSVSWASSSSALLQLSETGSIWIPAVCDPAPSHEAVASAVSNTNNTACLLSEHAAAVYFYSAVTLRPEKSITNRFELSRLCVAAFMARTVGACGRFRNATTNCFHFGVREQHKPTIFQFSVDRGTHFDIEPNL